MFEVGDSDREHDLAGGHGFAVVESQTKPARHTIQAGDQLVFQLGHLPFLKRQTVGTECVEAYGDASVGIFNAPLRAEMAQRKVAIRIVDVGGEAVRLEAHLLGHVPSPAVHQAAKNTEGDAATSEVRSD